MRRSNSRRSCLNHFVHFAEFYMCMNLFSCTALWNSVLCNNKSIASVFISWFFMVCLLRRTCPISGSTVCLIAEIYTWLIVSLSQNVPRRFNSQSNQMPINFPLSDIWVRSLLWFQTGGHMRPAGFVHFSGQHFPLVCLSASKRWRKQKFVEPLNRNHRR